MTDHHVLIARILKYILEKDIEMTDIVKWLDAFLTDRLHIDPGIAEFINTAVLIAAMIMIALCINWIVQSAFRWISKHRPKLIRSRWHTFLVKRKLGHHILLLIPGIIFYMLPYIAFERGTMLVRILHRIDIVYMLVVVIVILNSILLAFLDFYLTTGRNRSRPLQGLIQGLQVILYFIGAIIIVAVVIDKSPKVLLTGLGASAAILMLVFKDSILGFVAGVQLAQNNMIKIGDWIQMPDGSANGNVEEITLNTVKVRNWDNTITMIPPYTLVSAPFKNWRGMQESGGRRADKNIYIDMTSLETCNMDMISDIRKAVPLMDKWFASLSKDSIPEEGIANVQLYRTYIELYLKSHPDINTSLDLIITQKEATPYGLPIYVYFFIKDKTWAPFERKQSDIFDHLMTIPPEFGLRLYQRP